MRANRAFGEMVGYSEDELQGLSYEEPTHPEDRTRDTESFRALQRGERASGTSLARVVCKDGTVVWLELHVTIFREGDRAVNIAVVTT